MKFWFLETNTPLCRWSESENPPRMHVHVGKYPNSTQKGPRPGIKPTVPSKQCLFFYDISGVDERQKLVTASQVCDKFVFCFTSLYTSNTVQRTSDEQHLKRRLILLSRSCTSFTISQYFTQHVTCRMWPKKVLVSLCHHLSSRWVGWFHFLRSIRAYVMLQWSKVASRCHHWLFFQLEAVSDGSFGSSIQCHLMHDRLFRLKCL